MEKETTIQVLDLIQELNEKYWDITGIEDMAPFSAEMGYDGFRIIYEGTSILYSEDEVFYDDNDNEILIKEVFIRNWKEFKGIISQINFL